MTGTNRATTHPTRRRRWPSAPFALLASITVLAACGGDDDSGLGAGLGATGAGEELPFDTDQRCGDERSPGCLLNPAEAGTVFVDDEWTVRHAGGRLERLDATAPGGYDFEHSGPMVALLFLEVTNNGDEASTIRHAIGDSVLMSIGTMHDCTPEAIPANGDIEPGETLMVRLCGTDGSDGTVTARLRFPCRNCDADLVVYPGEPAGDDVLEALTDSVTTVDGRTPDGAALSRWEEEVAWLQGVEDRADAPAPVEDTSVDGGFSAPPPDDEVAPPPPPPPSTPHVEGTMPTSGDAESRLTGFWEAYGGTWQDGSAFDFMAANNYPGMGDDPDECRRGFLPVVDVRDVEVGATEADPGWVITGTGPLAGERPDGTVYATRITATYVHDDGSTAEFDGEVHSAIVDDDIYGFFPCA